MYLGSTIGFLGLQQQARKQDLFLLLNFPKFWNSRIRLCDWIVIPRVPGYPGTRAPGYPGTQVPGTVVFLNTPLPFPDFANEGVGGLPILGFSRMPAIKLKVNFLKRGKGGVLQLKNLKHSPRRTGTGTGANSGIPLYQRAPSHD